MHAIVVTVMRTVKIIPTSKRAKERVRQHGETMRLMTMARFRGKDAIFVGSLGDTSAGNRKWFGWFDGSEIDLDKTLETVSLED